MRNRPPRFRISSDGRWAVDPHFALEAISPSLERLYLALEHLQITRASLDWAFIKSAGDKFEALYLLRELFPSGGTQVVKSPPCKFEQFLYSGLHLRISFWFNGQNYAVVWRTCQ
ncbi:MAG: hypothetical protein UY63_C0014G0006 [Parcubacteria group bacterium GW2011_GWA2_51_10]|nr:MAG: hypothetical protein UY63_C0014G0006 [Parcubacteria group bacterium GW2011_GWA2_51_10]